MQDIPDSKDMKPSNRDIVPIAAEEQERETASKLLACVSEEKPRLSQSQQRWREDKVYEPGKSGEDWIADRAIALDKDGHPTQAVFFGLRMDDKLYTGPFAGETIASRVNLEDPEPRAVRKGSSEYDKVMNRINNVELFDSCPKIE